MNRDPDVKLFQVMDTRAKDALQTVRSAMQGEGVGQVDLVPYWAMPAAVAPGMRRLQATSTVRAGRTCGITGGAQGSELAMSRRTC